jgi:hypothetical protein
MATTIENFMNQAMQKQFSRDFLFRIKQISVTGLSLNGETDLIYARTATFPGRNIENKTVSYSGQTFNLPGKATYPGSEGWSVEFFVDQNLDIRTKLEAASRVLFDNETTTGNICMPGYESVITLDVLQIPCQRGPNVVSGSELQVGKTIELIGASLRDISEVSYEIADGTGEIKTFNATFAYHFYRNFANA